ncbi:MAG: endo alpha-1,4 polygalactosaminidase [Nocardioidaceae bacterium]|nr:MAG: endo alpha-1,4 polygalactosaminidase [Nocardioidaceae bacterium]
MLGAGIAQVLAQALVPLLAAGLLGTTVVPPTPNVGFDYQLGGVTKPAAGVKIVVRDRTAKPAKGCYNVCYLNAFQTQPDALGWWRKKHFGLVLKRRGKPVVDGDWGEWLLDTRKPRKLAAVVKSWIDRCARDGFDAVEFDNLDSWSRSHRLLKRKHNKAYAKLLVKRAHKAGLATGQKNWAGLKGTRLGFDFAIAEECGRYRECGRYVREYGTRVYVIEYRRKDFDKTCDRWGDRLSVILRDRELRSHGVHRAC